MKVWIVAPTDYDQYGIEGVYISLEAAKASVPYAKDWALDKDGSWFSGPHHLRIYEDEVQG
jgi:hypothetical protein